MCAILDGERPDVYSEKERRARKPHTCAECRSVIPVGAAYWRREGRCDGQWFSEAMCASCQDWMQAYVDAQREVCGEVYGWTFDWLWQEICDFVEEHFGYARKVIVDGHVLMEALVPASTVDA